MFFKPTPRAAVRTMLNNERAKLREARQGLQWAESMVEYHSKRIDALQAELSQMEAPDGTQAATKLSAYRGPLTVLSAGVE